MVVVVAAVALDTCDVGGRADAAHQGARRDRVLTRPLEGLGVGVGLGAVAARTLPMLSADMGEIWGRYGGDMGEI